MPEIGLAGRVVIVTGAGGALGRSYAMLLARRGASVVVNDVGTGDNGPSADVVAAEITAAGGRAVANRSSVDNPADAAAIVASALDAFGQVDAVVNNAGILRDRSFAKMTEQEVRDVLEVHVLGAFHVTMAAWPHLKEQGYGRVVNTTSPAGLYGNFGQANYAAAKMALVGLTRTLAIEGRKAGIAVNAVAPVAASPMTETILPPEALAKIDPDLVAPVVALLCSAACPTSGSILAAGGGHVARVAVTQGPGVHFGASISPETLAKRWDDVASLNGGLEFDGAAAHGDWLLSQL
ncbi:SDR family NAD(P)-dependent oxidoreductase [Phytoactinopolyspora mesophila]|uniref:SDR family NAD(P)-dependent oxidoreductase n=1 Tax=Phytoactinopolyspora mesophila TaxID=2650750 RepID=A0A7K3LXL3_9ACTN|nr:SDR family NAD(P)-dependent oxidoreductase [Phytoactinopolyspora mesophila]